MTLRLYVSDVHLLPGDTPEDARRLRAFTNLLRAAPDAEIDEIYVLGDLCEMWIGDDDDSPLVSTLTTLFQDLKARVALHFLPGNRDFLLGQAFADRSGLEILSDPYLLTDGTLLSHGDSLCTDDTDYQQLRTLLRSSDWQADILSKSLEERRAFGASLRAQSKAANANKASNIMDVNVQAVHELIVEYNAPLLIHGHTHRPGIHPATPAGQRLVLGAWERCGWWALQRDDQIELRCAGIDYLSEVTAQVLARSTALRLKPEGRSEIETPVPAAQ